MVGGHNVRAEQLVLFIIVKLQPMNQFEWIAK
jgi:hypothetical protein